MTGPTRAACTMAAVALAALLAAPAAAQGMKINDSTTLRVGILGQTWADWSENVRQDTSYAQNIFERRIRLLASGQWGSRVSFFFETDNPNLGRSGAGFTKGLGSGFITQDAYVEVKPTGDVAFAVDAGLMLYPLCRNCLQSAATLLPIDYGAYSFVQSGPTTSSVGRDVGFQAKGNVVGQRLEYRVGIFQGFKNTVGTTQIGSNTPRFGGRLQYNFLDAEAPAFFYSGTYFGKKKIFALGGGFDTQSKYHAYAVDAFFEHPVGPGGISAQADFVQYDGDTFFTALPKQNDYLLEAGYYINSIKIMPWVKIEGRSYDVTSVAAFQNEHRIQVGGTYYMAGHNLNVKAAYARNSFDRLNNSTLDQNQFTVQLQGFIY